MCDPMNPSSSDLELDHQLMEILKIHEIIFTKIETDNPDWHQLQKWMEKRGKAIDQLLTMDRPARKSSSASALFDRFEAEHRKLDRLLFELLNHQRGQLREAGQRAEAEKGYRLSGDPDNSYY
ncbi:MAG: hypothetical protein WEA36_10425 [Balneolaceae bacterium]